MKKVLLASLALLLLAFFALPAMADISQVFNLVTTDGSHYTVSNLSFGGQNLRLFEPPSDDPYGLPPQDTPPELWWHNNRGTLFNGPGGYPDYVPSPGYSSAGEVFDLEGVFWRYVGDTQHLMVWVVTSIAPTGAVYNNNHYLMGDVFFSTDGNISNYEYALISFESTPTVLGPDNYGQTTPWNDRGLRDAGDLVSLDGDDGLYGINGPNSYVGNATIRGQAYPWAAEHPDDLVYDGNLVYQEITGDLIEGLDDQDGSTREVNYSRPANLGTYVYFFDVVLGLTEQQLTYLGVPDAFHVTVQCGNDEGGNPDGGGGGYIPAPGALILGIIGAALVGLRRRMKA